MDFIMTIVEQGLIYGILTLGIYITYKILDFPDLTVDGSFPLGAAVTAALITRGVNPYLTIPMFPSAPESLAPETSRLPSMPDLPPAQTLLSCGSLSVNIPYFLPHNTSR